MLEISLASVGWTYDTYVDNFGNSYELEKK